MPAIGLNLGALLKDIGERADALNPLNREPETPPDYPTILARLKQVAASYTRTNPFKVGDVVSPRKDACTRGAGDPYIVVAIRETDYDFAHGEPHTNDFGGKMDTRIIGYSGPHISAHWAENADLEFWVEPVA